MCAQTRDGGTRCDECVVWDRQTDRLSRQTDSYNTKSLAIIGRATYDTNTHTGQGRGWKKERVICIHTWKERWQHKKVCECIMHDIHIHNYKIIWGRYKSVGLCIRSLVARWGRGRNVWSFSGPPLVLTGSLIGLLHRSLTGSTHRHLGVVIFYINPQGFDFVGG